MEDKQFALIVELKIADIISIIMATKSLDFEDALQYLYTSELYKVLTIEDTKLWHLSVTKLFDMLENEKVMHVLSFPDYV